MSNPQESGLRFESLEAEVESLEHNPTAQALLRDLAEQSSERVDAAMKYLTQLSEKRK